MQLLVRGAWGSGDSRTVAVAAQGDWRVAQLKQHLEVGEQARALPSPCNTALTHAGAPTHPCRR